MKEQNDITMAAGPWGPFPELCGSTPRQVKWKAAGIMNIIVAIVFPFAAIGIGNGLYEKVAREQRLRQEGRETDAVATRVWRYVGRYAHHVVAYEFAAGGEVRRGEAELPRPMWLGLSKGSHLTVRYVPSAPAINRAAAVPGAVLPIWLPFAVAALPGGIAVLAFFDLVRERHLLSHGQPATGVVTRSTGPRGARYRHAAKYEFQLPDGSTVKGKSQPVYGLPAGESVWVLYDPKHPRKSAIYPMRLVRIPK